MWKAAGIPLVDCVRMLTSTPAAIIGVSNSKGRLAPGFDADLVMFDDEVKIRNVMISGELI